MKKRSSVHKQIQLTTLAILLVLSTCLKAQNTGPVAPEAMSFEPVDATDMVNLLTGDFSYVLPILEVPGPEGGYPIALSYHAGIAMDQEASWVGLGWNINAGAINRGIVGVPDDWKLVESIAHYYDEGGESHLYSVGVGVGYNGVNIGVQASWGTNKAFGGSVSFGGGIKGFASVGADLGTNGVGVSASIGVGGDNSPLSFGGHAGIYDGYLSGGVSMKSLGMSLSRQESRWNFSIMGNSLSQKGIGATNGDYSVSNSKFGGSFIIPIPTNSGLLTLNLSYGHYTTKWWLNKTYRDYTSGTLYLESARSYATGYMNDEPVNNVQKSNYGMDIYNIPLGASNYKNEIDFVRQACLTFPAYDNYILSAQGISGKITPHLYESGELVGFGKHIQYSETGLDWEKFFYVNNNNSTTDKFLKSPDEIYFTMENEFSSYLRVLNEDWTWNGTDLLENFGGSIDKIDGNYSTSKKRFITGTHIDWISNYDIENNINLVSRSFIEALAPDGSSIDRSKFPADGIGAINVTTADGKTYHFSQPVYQFEEYYQDKQKSGTQWSKSYKFSPYAYTWLLTSITGPDYIDNDHFGLGTFGPEDFGYWVEFSYGKWSEAYGWRTPYNETRDYNMGNQNRETVHRGRKEICYLNWIRTRTHTAFFIKQGRSDGLGKLESIFGPPELIEEDIVFYPDEIPDGVNCETNESINFIPSGNDPLLWVECDKYSNKMFRRFGSSPYIERTLKLAKIILIKNYKYTEPWDFSTINNPSSPLYTALDPAPHLVGEIGVGEFYTNFLLKCHELGNCGQDNRKLCIEGPELTGVYGNIEDNVLDVNDPDIDQLENYAIKTIEFKFKYNVDEVLCKGTYNSNALRGSKLTLSEVYVLGENNTLVSPPYQFNYYNYSGYDENRADTWGYDLEYVYNWSLKEINTPIGSKIKIIYEEDRYSRVGISNIQMINNTFEFHLADENSTTLSISDPEGVLDLADYFEDGDIITITSEATEAITEESYWGERYCIEEPHFHTTTHVIDGEVQNNSLPLDHSLSDFIVYEDNGPCDGYFFKQLVGVEVSPENQFERVAGGIRVSSITIQEPIKDMSYMTNYSYFEGFTVYEPVPKPFENEKYYIPYFTELPMPTVMYGIVNVENTRVNGEFVSKTQYIFDIPEASSNYADVNFNLDDKLIIQDGQDFELQFDDDENFAKFYGRNGVVHNNIASIGRLLKVSSYNQLNQKVGLTEYKYRPFENIRFNITNQQGIRQETFRTKKRSVFVMNPDSYDEHKSSYRFISSSRISYPNILDEVLTTSNGLTISIKNIAYDLSTGKLLKSVTELATGEMLQTEIVQAHTKYPGNDVYIGMGSKVIRPDNYNMMSQEAASYTYVLDPMDPEGEPIGTISANVQTWKPTWPYREYTVGIGFQDETVDGVWRKFQNFAWKGDIDDNGLLSGFTEFNFNEFGGSGENWIKVNEISRYDHFSHPIESSDINEIYLASKYDNNFETVFLTGENTNYFEVAFSGAEDHYIEQEFGKRFLGGEVEFPDGDFIFKTTLPDYIHSGTKAVVVDGPGEAFRYTYNFDSYEEDVTRNYKASVWIYNDDNANHLRLGFKYLNAGDEIYWGDNTDDGIGTEFIAGDWILVSILIPNPEEGTDPGQVLGISNATSLEVSVRNTSSGTGAPIYCDDFRFHPVNASVNSYVYDKKTGNIITILDNDNIATFYEYDAAGRLENVKRETKDGVKLVNETKYNFSRTYEFHCDFKAIPSIPVEGEPVNFQAASPDFEKYEWIIDGVSTGTEIGPIYELPEGEEFDQGNHSVKLKVWQQMGDELVLGQKVKYYEVGDAQRTISISPPDITIYPTTGTPECGTGPFGGTFTVTNTGNQPLDDLNITYVYNGELHTEVCDFTADPFSLDIGEEIDIPFIVSTPEGCENVYNYITIESLMYGEECNDKITVMVDPPDWLLSQQSNVFFSFISEVGSIPTCFTLGFSNIGQVEITNLYAELVLYEGETDILEFCGQSSGFNLQPNESKLIDFKVIGDIINCPEGTYKYNLILRTDDCSNCRSKKVFNYHIVEQ